MFSLNLQYALSLLESFYKYAVLYQYNTLFGIKSATPMDDDYDYSETPAGLMHSAITLFHKEVPEQYRHHVVHYYHNGAFRIVGGSMTEEDFWKSLDTPFNVEQ